MIKTDDLKAMRAIKAGTAPDKMSGITVIHYDGDKETGRTTSTHALGAMSDLLANDYDHVDSKDNIHTFVHSKDKNISAKVFGQRAKVPQVPSVDNDVKKTEVVLRDSYEYHPKDGPRYHIYEEGSRVTDHDKPLSLKHINNAFGGVKNLESAGFRLVPHKEKMNKGTWIGNPDSPSTSTGSGPVALAKEEVKIAPNGQWILKGKKDKK